MAWYENFFDGVVQNAWKAAQTDEQTEIEVDFLYDVLALQPGLRVLDVFCGYGRHALALAQLGCSVTGVDISAESIAELQQEAREQQLPVEAVPGDFLTLPVPSGFDAAYCFGNSFSFFAYPQMQEFLQKIAGHLRPGGWFVADTGMIAESILPDFSERSWMRVGDITLLIENEYDVLEGRIDSHLTYLHQGRTEHRKAQHYLYTVAELGRLFRLAGLSVEGIYGSLDGSDFLPGDERLLLLARKA